MQAPNHIKRKSRYANALKTRVRMGGFADTLASGASTSVGNRVRPYMLSLHLDASFSEP
jgi:hypothetical protein